jgi:hypothetical protein
MHDLDRTQMEQYELEMAGSGFGQELEQYEGQQYFGESGAGELEIPLGELQEMELASELLEVTSEQELEQFLGNLVRSVGRAAGGLMRSPLGQQLVAALKSAAQQALPLAGGALGNLIAPGAGGAVGSRLATQAGAALGLELEGLSPQDQEFETARQFVRFANAATKQAATAPAAASPARVVQAAVQGAAQQYAPGLLSQLGAAGGQVAWPGNGYQQAGAHRRRPTSGRWVRRGHVVILYGI